MATLTTALKNQIILQEPSKGAEPVFEAIMKYDNLSLDDFPNMDPKKRAYIQKKIDELPNPNEQTEWSGIKGFIGQGQFNPTAIDTLSLQTLHGMLGSYIANWGMSLPLGNHVDEATQLNNAVSDELAERKKQQEASAWQTVDKGSISSLKGYLIDYPASVHKDEIDDCIWKLTDIGDENAVNSYLNDFPNGLHSSEARNIANAFVTWNSVDQSDIFAVYNYVNGNSQSPVIGTAQNTLGVLKRNEIGEMITYSASYDTARFSKLINLGVFTETELVGAGVAPKNVIDILLNPNARDGLDINAAIATSSPVCKTGYTDVYFFGVPSTGKTCILMGLMRSELLNINNAVAGGDYADQLTLHCQKGFVVDRTPGTFTTTIEATMYGKDNHKIKHGVNFVEMSGEEFAFQIAANPDHEVSFDDMGGSQATGLLKNGNRKVFFLIIDPTAAVVTIQRNVTQMDSQGNPILDGYGNPIVNTVTSSANQTLILQRMINLFNAPENAEIMKKVDALHIIVTKADTLGPNKNVRNDTAKGIFDSTFSATVLQGLKDLCEEYNINSNIGFSPKLYTFSLGNFHIGGLFNYDSSDSDLLVKAVRNSTRRIKAVTFWDKVKRICNARVI